MFVFQDWYSIHYCGVIILHLDFTGQSFSVLLILSMQLCYSIFHPAWNQDCWECIFALFWIFIPGAFRKAFPTQEDPPIGQGGIFAETLERVINGCLVELLYHWHWKGQWMASTTWDWDLGLNEAEVETEVTGMEKTMYEIKTWVVWQRLESKTQPIPSQTKPHKDHNRITLTLNVPYTFHISNAYIYLPSPPLISRSFQIIFCPQQEGPSPVC